MVNTVCHRSLPCPPLNGTSAVMGMIAKVKCRLLTVRANKDRGPPHGTWPEQRSGLIMAPGFMSSEAAQTTGITTASTGSACHSTAQEHEVKQQHTIHRHANGLGEVRWAWPVAGFQHAPYPESTLSSHSGKFK